jgi:hypothetical protein
LSNDKSPSKRREVGNKHMLVELSILNINSILREIESGMTMFGFFAIEPV